MARIKLMVIWSIFVLSITYVSAQTGGWQWAVGVENPDWLISKDTALDNQGNLYVVGEFRGTSTFGSHTITTSLYNSEVFVAKMDRNGNWLWVTQTQRPTISQSVGATGIVVDNTGNCYVSGHFTDTALFGSISLTSTSTSMFVAKIDSAGSWQWVQTNIQITSNSYARSLGLAISDNFLCVTGSYYRSIGFGTTTLGYESSNRPNNYIAKLDRDGNWISAIRSYGYNVWYKGIIAIDEESNAYIFSGSFTGLVPFGSITLTSQGTDSGGNPLADIFIAKLDANNNWVWAIKGGGLKDDGCLDVDVNNQGECFITGYYQSTANFGSIVVTSSTEDTRGTFVAKVSSNGSWEWVSTSLSSYINQGGGIRVNSNNEVLVTGLSDGNINFGPIQIINGGDGALAFVCKLDSLGNWLWVRQATSTESVRGNHIELTANNHYMVTGLYFDQATFGINNITTSYMGIFVAKLLDPGMALLSDKLVSFGDWYLEEASEYQTVLIANSCFDAISVSDLHFGDSQGHYQFIGPTTPFTLSPGETSTILVRFLPHSVGSISDTLFIVNDSQNVSIVKVTLTGISQYVPPRPPENVTIEAVGQNTTIVWDAVTQNIFGAQFTPDYYLIFYNGSDDPNNGTYYYLARSYAPSYIHDGVLVHAQHMFYKIFAFKFYGSRDMDPSLLLIPGMTEQEVIRIIGRKADIK